MEIQIINLTPHSVTVLSSQGVVFDPRTRSSRVEDGHTPVVLRCYEPTAGAIPLCTQVETDLGELDGVPLVGMQFADRCKFSVFPWLVLHCQQKVNSAACVTVLKS